MTEPRSEPDPRDRRMTTGEFRAMPDTSASTAQFQAFAAGQGERTGKWAVPGANGRGRGRLALLILSVIIVVAILAIIAVTVA